MRVFNLFTRWFRMDAYSLNEITKRLDTIIEQNRTLIQIGEQKVTKLQEIIDEVTELKTVHESVDRLLVRLNELLDRPDVDLEEVRAVAAEIRTLKEAMIESVIANTRAEENDEEPDPEDEEDENGGGEPEPQQRF